MTITEAEAVLLHSVQNNDGIYTILRMGNDPGKAAIDSLKLSLHKINKHYASADQLPRMIAIACGVIMHFASECHGNINAQNANSDLQECVGSLEQLAFNALVGDAWR